MLATPTATPADSRATACRGRRLNDALGHQSYSHARDPFGRSVAALLATLAARADVLQQSDRPAGGRRHSSRARAAIPTQPPELFARYEQTLACALARGGRPDQAEPHYQRARRVYVALGHTAGEPDLLRQREAAVGAASDRSQNGSAPHGPARAAATTIGDIASIMLHAGQPELVAREVVGLLDAAGCVRSATAEARAADGSVEVLAQAGEPHEGDQSDAQASADRTGTRATSIVIVHARRLGILSDRQRHRLAAGYPPRSRAGQRRSRRARRRPIDERPSRRRGPVTIGHMREMTLARRVARHERRRPHHR